MKDLSTPLLDAVHSKLNNPSLSCKSLAYEASTFSGYSVVSNGQSVASDGTSTTAVSSSPPTPAPTTTPLKCPEGYSGSLPYDGCLAYHYCVWGTPTGDPIYCPEGTLYSESGMLCLHSETVTCSLTQSPSISPTDKPTLHPTISMKPTFERGAVVDEDRGSIMSISNQQHNGPNPPSSMPTERFNVSVGSHPDSQPQGDQSSTASDMSTSSMMNEPNNSISVSTNFTLKEEGVSSTFTASTAISSQLSPQCTPCTEGYTGFNPSTDCSKYCVCQEGRLLEGSLYSCPYQWLFDAIKMQCMPMLDAVCNQFLFDAEQSPSLGEEPQVINDSNNDPIEAGETTPTMETQPQLPSNHFTIDGAFVTIEIKLPNNPSDISWSLLSFDGTINVSKPPGTYSSFETDSYIYEAISLENGASDHELTIIISSIGGDGLCCSHGEGHFKIYNGQPEESNLLLTGGEFGYYEMTSLFLTEDGELVLLSEHSTDEATPTSAENSAPVQAAVVINTDQNTQQTNTVEQETQQTDTSESTQSNVGYSSFFQSGFGSNEDSGEGETTKKSRVVPALISVVAVSLLIGATLLFVAHKRRTLQSSESMINYFEDHDGDNSTIRSWSNHSNEHNDTEVLDVESAYHPSGGAFKKMNKMNSSETTPSTGSESSGDVEQPDYDDDDDYEEEEEEEDEVEDVQQTNNDINVASYRSAHRESPPTLHQTQTTTQHTQPPNTATFNEGSASDSVNNMVEDALNSALSLFDDGDDVVYNVDSILGGLDDDESEEEDEFVFT